MLELEAMIRSIELTMDGYTFGVEAGGKGGGK